mmetsp:Transcript_14241/g.32369  ORF Transcript_14241/g.32369 Transcript_14241/m.32369 type:complete len:361 (+) Transcript_14241:198-1280(+)
MMSFSGKRRSPMEVQLLEGAMRAMGGKNGVNGKPGDFLNWNMYEWHIVGANCFTLGLLALSSACPNLMELSTRTQMLLVVLSGAFFGMPHGALDGVLLWGDGRLFTIVTVFSAYIALAAGMITLWLVLPSVALVVFLLCAVFHFGEGDHEAFPVGMQWLDTLARGGMFLISFYCKWGEVLPILQILVGPATDLTGAVAAIQLLQVVHFISFVACVGYHCYRIDEARSLLLIVELSCLFSAFAILPPLVGLTLYYNVYHSSRHYLRVTELSDASAQSSLAAAVGFTALALVLIGIFFAFEQARGLSGTLTDLDLMLRVGIIAVSAMTAPHMVVVHHVSEGFQKKKQLALPTPTNLLASDFV